MLGRWLLAKCIYDLADGIVAISYGAKRDLVSFGLAESRNIWVVHNGVDSRFRVLGTPERDTRGESSGKVIMGMACRLTISKGVLDALKLLALLPNHWHLWIAGDGPARDEALVAVFIAGT